MAVDVGSAVAYLELDTSKFSNGFASAFNDMKVFASKSATTEQKLKGLQGAFKTTGGMLSKTMTLPLVGVGTASVKMASDFEQGMAEVQAISGATSGQLVRLKEKAIEMGAKTKFSAGESAEAFKYMAMAGWETEDMLDGISGIMDLASASGEDLALVSDIVTDSLTAFGLQAKDSSHFADVLAKASSKSNTNVAMMGETFKYVAPVAGALGYSVEDTAVAIGLLANAGIKGSQAGTVLRGLLSRLVKPTDQVAEAMEQLGINITNADGTMKPFDETIKMLRNSFSGLSEAEKAQYSAILAGQEGMSGLLAIINASDEDFEKLTKEINNADGASKSMAETMMNTTKGAVEQLKGALESAGIIIGERLTPYIRKLAEFITKLVEKFNVLSEEQQDSVVKWGLILASIGPVLLILSKLIGVVITVAKAFKTTVNIFRDVKAGLGLVEAGYSGLATQMGGIPKIIAGIAGGTEKALVLGSKVIGVVGAIIAVFATLWKTNEDFRNKITETFKELIGTISDFFGGFISRVKELGGAFSGVTNVIKKVWVDFCNILAPIFTGAFGIVVEVVKSNLDTVLSVLDIFIGIFTGDWGRVKDAVVSILEGLLERVVNIIGIIFETIGGIGSKILELLGFEEASEKFGEFFNSIADWFRSIPELIMGFVDSIVEFFTVTIPQAFDDFIAIIPEKIEAIKQWFAELPYNLGVFIGEMIGHIYLFGQSVADWIANDLPVYISNIVDWFAQLPSRIWTWLCDVVSRIVQWGANIVSEGRTAVTNFISTFISFLSQLPSKVWGIIKQIPEKVRQIGSSLKQAGADIFNNLWDGIKSIGESILGWVSDFASKIGDFVSGIIQGFKNIVSGADEAKTASRSVDGSHANGLSYVPFNGYIAELHEGERVLTAQENKEYNKRDRRSSGGDTYNFYNVPSDPYESARLVKKAKQELVFGL